MDEEEDLRFLLALSLTWVQMPRSSSSSLVAERRDTVTPGGSEGWVGWP